MAQMFYCGRDWTYDLFVGFVAKCMQTEPSENESDEMQFTRWFIKKGQQFKEKWYENYGAYYVPGIGYAGDAFANEFDWGYFSDWYKDVYGQRPHLENWYYATWLGMPMQDDISRMFCANPIDDAIEQAKRARNEF